MSKWRWLQGVFMSVMVLHCVGCMLVSQKEGAPVVDSTPYDIQHDRYHIVKRGDTLYTIAWRYGLDYHALAKANRLRSPDHILVGQRLSLDVSKVDLKKTPWRQSVDKLQSLKDKTVKKSNVHWGWPVKGPLLMHYGTRKSHDNKGIDIGGALGKPIRSAAAGTVVYAGAGLRGYGKLIIVKHDEVYLSAYAHNQVILVEEGDSVRLGQIIARMGKTDTEQVKLHFEIRQNGQPVDPLCKLPPL